MNLSKLFDTTKFNFFMVDVESDGLSTIFNSMTSLCVVQFDPDDGQIIQGFHKKFSKGLSRRNPDKETLEWRKENNVDKMEEELEEHSPIDLLNHLYRFLGGYTPDKKAIIFANHTEFDISFIKGYYEATGASAPWDYNKVFELNSILLGRGIQGNGKSTLIENLLASRKWQEVLKLHFGGKEAKHNAFYDCVFQIELLMAAFEEGE